MRVSDYYVRVYESVGRTRLKCGRIMLEYTRVSEKYDESAVGGM